MTVDASSLTVFLFLLLKLQVANSWLALCVGGNVCMAFCQVHVYPQWQSHVMT